jgi:hypothetical protein
MKMWRELPSLWRKYGLMERSSNSRGHILTNPESSFIIGQIGKLRMVAERIILGKCQLLDMLPKVF